MSRAGAMNIRSYRFGNLDVDGRSYTSDVVITPELVPARSMKTSVVGLVSSRNSRRSRPARVGLVRPAKPQVVRQQPHAEDSQRHKHAEEAGAQGTA